MLTMLRKLTPVLAAVLAGALVALFTNLAGLGDVVTMLIGALVLIPLVAIGTPHAVGIRPLRLARRPPGRQAAEG